MKARPGTAPADACPCDLGRPYRQCCGRYHPAGELTGRAPDAAALMRSRYVAYVLGLERYLLETWHASTRPDAIGPGPARWLGLTLRRHEGLDAAHQTVEFVARYRDGSGRAGRHHETSRFVLEQAHWLYVDGDLHA